MAKRLLSEDVGHRDGRHAPFGASPDDGSYTIEGIVAIGVFYVLLALIVQIGFLVLARGAAATSVEASLRSAVVADLDIGTLAYRIERDVTSVVPGAQEIEVEVTHGAEAVRAVVRFRWVPPGPDLVPVTVSIERSVARVVPP